jgi:DNA-binding NarL/FixJ family response regulator
MKRKDAIIRVLIASADVIFREGLRELLDAESDFSVVGEAGDLAACLALAGPGNPDVFVLDLELKAVCKELEQPAGGMRGAAIIVLVDEPQPRMVVEALRSGVRAVFPKDSPVAASNKCIRAIAGGGYSVGSVIFPTQALALKSVRHIAIPEILPGFRLTRRELEISASVVSGRTNKEMSRIHCISEDTVKHHLSNIFDKVGVYNRLELALFMVHHGIVGKAMLVARGGSEETYLRRKPPVGG